MQIGERAGFIVFGKSYAGIELSNTANGLVLNYVVCEKADKGNAEQLTTLLKNIGSTLHIKMQMNKGAVAKFEYSVDGINYQQIPFTFVATPGLWVGAKMGFYCTSNKITNDAGYVEIKSFTIQK